TAWSAHPAGKTVAIFGLGPIGLMAITVCKAMGAGRVLAVGHKNQFRLDLAKKVGADRVLKDGDDVVRILQEESGGDGVDEVLEFSGAPSALQHGLDALKPAGGIHLLGTFTQSVTLDVSKAIVFKAARVVGIHGRRMFQDWQLMQGLLRSGKLNLDPIITHKLRLAEYEKGFEAMDSANSGKVVMFVD
ncbi:MAG TPA: zinc-binding dehydrogenase, partial [Chloroflexota bacterium]|nr:zinc-binding dehydrogenase [Chloroflexota bacterium]